MRKYCFITLLVTVLSLSSSSFVSAQDDNLKPENPISINLDLMSRYVWRGLDYGASPSIQPGIEYSESGFALGAWGAYTTNRPGVQEVDLYASYTYKEKFTFLLTDYYFPDEYSDYNYFDYASNSTGHILEASVSFNGSEKCPFSLLLASNFWGADATRINQDGSTGNLQYSTYAELGYSLKFIDLFMGWNLTKVDKNKGEVGYYGDSIGIVNLGISTSKEISITNTFSLPLQVSLITNPQAGKIYLVAGFTF